MDAARPQTLVQCLVCGVDRYAQVRMREYDESRAWLQQLAAQTQSADDPQLASAETVLRVARSQLAALGDRTFCQRAASRLATALGWRHIGTAQLDALA